jgi:DNA-binding transcriptional LysR family regulator
LLERRLGVSVIERGPLGTRLTPDGERFIQEATQAAEHLERATIKLRQPWHGRGGALRVGVSASLSGGFLADLIGTYRRRFPNVSVMLEEGSSQSNAASVLAGRLDAAFISGVHRLSGCNSLQLWEERIFVALPNEHALASRTFLRWPEIRGETFIVSASGSGPEIHDHLIRQLSSIGFRPQIDVQKVSRENLLNLVARGFGITLAVQSTTAAPYHGVAFVPLEGEDERVVASVVWPSNSANQALKSLLELGTSIARKYSRPADGVSTLKRVSFEGSATGG